MIGGHATTNYKAEPGRPVPGRKEETMYMSYCRFEGTYHELRACMGEVEEHIYEEAEYSVSDNEINYFRKIVELMAEFLVNEGIIDEYGELSDERLDQICNKLGQSFACEEA